MCFAYKNLIYTGMYFIFLICMLLKWITLTWLKLQTLLGNLMNFEPRRSQDDNSSDDEMNRYTAQFCEQGGMEVRYLNHHVVRYIGNFSREFNFRWVCDLSEIVKIDKAKIKPYFYVFIESPWNSENRTRWKFNMPFIMFQSLTKVLVTWWSFGPAQYKLLSVRIFFWWTELFWQFHIINEFTTCR